MKTNKHKSEDNVNMNKEDRVKDNRTKKTHQSKKNYQ